MRVCDDLFQFPSNGKAYMHTEIITEICQPIYSFNSLQTGKHICTSRTAPGTGGRWQSFNSLQTGKHICTEQIVGRQQRGDLGFNSLQTGKHICTGEWLPPPCYLIVVSIPFKRESIYGIGYWLLAVGCWQEGLL